MKRYSSCGFLHAIPKISYDLNKKLEHFSTSSVFKNLPKPKNVNLLDTFTKRKISSKKFNYLIRRPFIYPTYREKKLEEFFSSEFGRFFFFKETDLIEKATLGHGPGGQATNRRKQSVHLKHQPTQLIVRFTKFPSLRRNRLAARVLLHLRLEQYLLGDDSYLSQITLLKRKCARARLVKRNYLRNLGEKAIKNSRKQYNIFEFLLGSSSIKVDYLGIQGALKDTVKEEIEYIHIYDLFGQLCSIWWIMLVSSFNSQHYKMLMTDNMYSKSKSLRQEDTVSETHPSHDNQSGFRTVNQDFSIPLLWRLWFPSYSPSQGFSRMLVERCAKEEAVLKNVRRSLHCSLEVFGLFIEDNRMYSNSDSKNVIIQIDGPNWSYKKYRLFQENGHVQPLGKFFWTFCISALYELHLTLEAKALIVFFKSQKCHNLNIKCDLVTSEKDTAKEKILHSNHIWVDEILENISDLIGKYDSEI